MPIIDTHLYREIHQQPDVIRRFFNEKHQNIKDLADAIRQYDITHIVIAARGTSDNAGRYAQYVLGGMNRLVVALATPSLFSTYNKPPRLKNALVMGISQSGKSPDIVAVLSEAKQQGVLTAVITNSLDSDLANKGDFVIDLGAGEERAVAATKTYTAELAAIAYLSATLSGDYEMADDLALIPDVLDETLKMNEAISLLAPRYRYMERSVVIGRGYNYSTAFELALKLKELTYIVVEPYSSADFLHGPLAMIDHGFPVIVIAPSGKMMENMKSFVKTLNQRKAEVIGISDNPTILANVRSPLCLPRKVPEWLSPIPAIVPGQLLAFHLALARDYDVDSPRGIQKVTETN